MSSDPRSSPDDSIPERAGAVDAARAAFLAARFGSGVGEVSRLGHGEWSTAYAVRHDGVDYVARFGAYQEDFAKDRLAARYASPDLPIPSIVDIGEAFGGYLAISERAFGGFIDDLDGAQMRATLPALFAALDAARHVDLSATTAYGGWGADGNAPYPSWRAALLDIANDRPTAREHGWRDRMAGSPIGTEPFDEAFALLQDLVEYAPAERHLIHSDLLHFNVLVAEGRIAAVVDWGCSLYGDFLYDIAWFAFWAPWFPAWADIDFPREAARHYAAIGLDVPNFAERLRCCQIHIGLAGQAYQAFTERWDDLEATVQRTLAVARANP